MRFKTLQQFSELVEKEGYTDTIPVSQKEWDCYHNLLVPPERATGKEGGLFFMGKRLDVQPV